MIIKLKFIGVSFLFIIKTQAKHIRNDTRRLKDLSITVARSDINILKIISVDEFFGIIPTFVDKIDKVKKRLNEAFEFDVDREIIPVPKIGMVCAGYIQNIWYRVKIVKNNSHGQYEVYLVDTADTATVTWNNLCYLKDEFYTVPECVIQMSLHELRCNEGTREDLTDIFQKLNKKSKSFTVKFEQTMPFCFTVTLYAITNNMQRICINNELNNINQMSRGQAQLPNLPITPLKSTASTISSSSSEESNKTKIILTEYQTPENFYVVLTKDKERLRSIDLEVQEAVESGQLPQHINWRQHASCYVKKGEKWCRAIVVKCGGAISLVYLIDYGGMIKANLPEDLFEPIKNIDGPGLAIKCHLAFLEKTNKKTWSQTAIDDFQQYYQSFNELAISVPNTRSNTASVGVILWGFGCTEIRAFTPAKKIIRNINSYMLYNGLASSTTTNYDEFQCHDYKDVLTAIDSTRLLQAIISDNSIANDYIYNFRSNEPSEPFKWLPAAPIAEVTFQARVVYIDETMCFNAQTKEQIKRCEKISYTLTEWHQNQQIIPKITKWKEGEACVAKFRDNCYHRAQVMQVNLAEQACKVTLNTHMP